MAKMVNTYLWNKAEGGVPTQDFEALKNKVDSLANTTAKTNITNTFSTSQNFNGHINVLLDNMIQLGYGVNDIKLVLQSISGTTNAKVKANKGDLILEAATGRKISISNDIDMTPGKNIKSFTLVLGNGGQPVIAPDNDGKSLKFDNGTAHFTSLDFQNQTKLSNVPNIKKTTSNTLNNNANQTINLAANSIVLMVRYRDTGQIHTNWTLTDAGALTITNDTGVSKQFLITYWEV